MLPTHPESVYDAYAHTQYVLDVSVVVVVSCCTCTCGLGRDDRSLQCACFFRVRVCSVLRPLYSLAIILCVLLARNVASQRIKHWAVRLELCIDSNGNMFVRKLLKNNHMLPRGKSQTGKICEWFTYRRPHRAASLCPSAAPAKPAPKRRARRPPCPCSRSSTAPSRRT